MVHVGAIGQDQVGISLHVRSIDERGRGAPRTAGQLYFATAMTLPRRPGDRGDAEQDTFDFKGSQRRARTYMRQTLENAQDAGDLSGLSRDQMIAIAAVGGYLIVPTVAGIRAQRRKRARRKAARNSASDSNA